MWRDLGCKLQRERSARQPAGGFVLEVGLARAGTVLFEGKPEEGQVSDAGRHLFS